MRENELSPEQEAEVEQLAAETIREGARVGVDWDAAAERMRAVASEKTVVSDDGTSAEVVTLELDLSLLLRTLQQLPDGAGTERFLAAYENAGSVPETQPRLTSFAPQFLVDDLTRSIAFYEKLGFTFGEPWDGFYAIGKLDGLELHLKEAPKNEADRPHRREHEHLDAAAGVDGIEAFYERCRTNGIHILKPLTPTAWGTLDFYVEDPDGNVVSFGGNAAPRAP